MDCPGSGNVWRGRPATKREARPGIYMQTSHLPSKASFLLKSLERVEWVVNKAGVGKFGSGEEGRQGAVGGGVGLGKDVG